MRRVFLLLAVIIPCLAGCSGCNSPNPPAGYGPVWRDDGTEIPPPAYTNEPIWYQGEAK